MFNKGFLTGYIVIFVSIGMPVLQAQGPAASVAPMAQSAVAASTNVNSPQLEQRYPRYKVQNQDTLMLSFPLSPELNQTVTVQPDGFINLQTAGSIHIQGMTVPEVSEAIKTAYAGVLNNPIVNVDLEDFQKPFFTVTGQVGKPGQYDLRTETTVAEALAVAGGLSPTAKTQVFLYHRTSQDWMEVKKLNIKEVLYGKHLDEDAVLKPGDMIFVPEKFITNFKKYVPYSATTGTYVNP